MPRPAWTEIFLFVIPVAGMIGVYYVMQPSIGMESGKPLAYAGQESLSSRSSPMSSFLPVGLGSEISLWLLKL
jgi:hypothetical protein